MIRMILLVVAIALSITVPQLSMARDVYVNSLLPWHTAVLDSQGKLLAWYRPDKNLGYDKVLRLAWDFIEHKVPIDKRTGELVYLTSSTFNKDTLQGGDWFTNPASTFAHQVDAMLGWYPYSGDTESIVVVKRMLDYMLEHGTTPKGWEWAEVPFSTSCAHDKEYGGCLRGLPDQYREGLEPDKVAEMGLAYVHFYEMTGDRKYLEAGLKCAIALAKHVKPGDAYHTPWPFRISARTGAVLNGEDYGGLVVASVSLFDKLLALGEGDQEAFRAARDLAWKWILTHPLNRTSEAYDKWTGYYEDILGDTVNLNDMSPMMTARYIMLRDDPASVDPKWEENVGHLIDFSRALLGRGPYFGAWAIDEQQRPDGGIVRSREDMTFPKPGGMLPYIRGRGCCGRAGLICRTAAWAAVNAMYFALTGDGQAREDAFRSLNYATYFAGSDGKMWCCGNAEKVNPLWFEDGYGDAPRNFIWAMAAMPELAPIGQDHILGSSSVIQDVKYDGGFVEYRTFSKSSTEVLRLSFDPAHITADGVALQRSDILGDDTFTARPLGNGDFEVKIRHKNGKRIHVQKR